MANRFMSSEAYGVIAITANVDLTSYQFRGFIVNGAGNIAFEQPGNDTEVVLAVNASTIYPFAIVLVNSGNTTATGIHGVL